MGLKKFDYQINDNRMKRSYISLFVVIGVLIAGVVIYKSFAKFEVQDDFNVIAGKVHTPVVIQTGKVYDNNDDPTKPATYTLYDTGDLVVDFPEDCEECLVARGYGSDDALNFPITSAIFYDYIMNNSIFTQDEKDWYLDNHKMVSDLLNEAVLDSKDLIYNRMMRYGKVKYSLIVSSLSEATDETLQAKLSEVLTIGYDEIFASIFSKIHNNFVTFNKVTINTGDNPFLAESMFKALYCNTFILNSTSEELDIVRYSFVGLTANRLIFPNMTLKSWQHGLRGIYSPNLDLSIPIILSNTHSTFKDAYLKSLTIPENMYIDFDSDFTESHIESVYFPSSVTEIKAWDTSSETTIYLAGPRSAYTITNPENFKGIVDCQKAELCES